MPKKLLWSAVPAAYLIALLGCSSTSGPDEALPADVASYHYTKVVSKRFYEIAPVPDVCVCDSEVVDTVFIDTLNDTTLIDTICVSYFCARDTLVDSVIQVGTDAGGVFWAESYRAIRHFYRDTSGALVGFGDSAAVRRREGRLADTLFLDPASPLRERLLVAPLVAGALWDLDTSGNVRVQVTGEEVLPLGIGATRCLVVDRSVLGVDWYAPGLGRVQYEERIVGGERIRATLIGIGSP